jgi:1-acyl-sn-glycerol-3-phosphate acyltransferase
MIRSAAWRSIRTASKGMIARNVDLTIEGQREFPATGPVIIAARHFHHLYDGCAVMATIDRPVSVLVGLDWIQHPMALKGMQAACRAAGWPVVYRDTSEVQRATWLPALRAAQRASLAILRDGQVLLIFPEGYPTIDPHGSPKSGNDDFLPFHLGFARIAIESWKEGMSTTIVPIGFAYEPGDKWQIIMRIGSPFPRSPGITTRALTAAVERAVIELSRPA